MLPGLIKRGELTIITHDGKTVRLGAPDPELNPVTVRLMDRRVALQIARDPTLGTVETYMEIGSGWAGGDHRSHPDHAATGGGRRGPGPTSSSRRPASFATL